MKSFAAVAVASLAAVAVAATQQPHAWWKEAVVYQVYPASFKETRDADHAIGWGDINGIIEGLDHIKDLGADIVWLSPFYDSPMKDMGYDISDYDSVNPLFGGSMADIRRLIQEAHARGMRVIWDLVVNHTSNQHRWFIASESSKDNPYRDWYYWRPPQYINGSRYPPNNWAGNNNGSAWKYEPKTEEYYLNIFNPFQPDLNWNNPVARHAIFYESMVYWLQEGIDGFRMDAFSVYSKPPDLPSIPSNNDSFLSGRPIYNNGPHEHEYLQQMHDEVLSHYETFTVGEYGITYDNDLVQKYIGADRNEINCVFLTNAVDIGRDGFDYEPYNLTGWREAINFTQFVGSPEAGNGWSTVFLENHDLPRSITRFLNDSPEYRIPSGKVLSMMLNTLSGTLFVYQQQEIGMINVPRDWGIDKYRDTYTLVYYEEVEEEGGNTTEALDHIRYLARDNARTPFNWNSSYAGFSPNDTTWMPQGNFDINLADQVNDPESVYTFWKQMIKFRKENKDLFVYGGFEFLDLQSENFLVYQKTSDEEDGGTAMVILNLSQDAGQSPVDVPDGAELMACTYDSCNDAEFRAYEGRVYKVKS